MGQDAAQDPREDLHALSKDELVERIVALQKGKCGPVKLEKFEYVIEQLMNGRSAASVFRKEQEGDEEKAPSESTFYRWLADTAADQVLGLMRRYDTALMVRAFREFEYMFEIADDGRNDWMEIFARDGESIGWKVNGEAVQRSKLRIDLRKWALARMDPKRFNEKQAAAGGGAQIQTKVIEYYEDKGQADDR